MSDITNKEIKKIASLAKIAVNENELENLASQLNKIVHWVEKLNEVKTDTSAITNVHSMTLEMHEDIVNDGNKTQEVLQNAKDAKYDYFTVPKVIE